MRDIVQAVERWLTTPGHWRGRLNPFRYNCAYGRKRREICGDSPGSTRQRKPRAMLGVEEGQTVLVGVWHSHRVETDDIKTKVDLQCYGNPPKKQIWQRSTVLSGVGDEVVIRIVGPGTYEVPPTKFFPLPPKPGS